MRAHSVLTVIATVSLSASGAPYDLAHPVPEPALFAEGIVSAGEFDTHPAFSPDGTEFYFVRSKPDFTDWKIYVSRFVNGTWQTPVMAPFSGRYRDADPFITPDGRQFYFISDRSEAGPAKGDMDIWVMDRVGDAWGPPRRVAGAINSAADEWYPHTVQTGALYFGSSRPGGQGQTDLYRAPPTRDGFDAPRNLGPAVNSQEDEYEPWVAPDESYLIFMAVRSGGMGSGDLYITFADKGGWTRPKNLGPNINGKGQEISAYVTPNGRYFFFASMRKEGDWPPGQRPNRAKNGLGDIYQMDLDALLTLAR
jgi:Tol biopolymer transport system component